MIAVVTVMVVDDYGCTGFDYFGTQIRPKPDPDLGTTRFSDHRTIHLMKPIASAMLSAAMKRQYSSLLPFFCQILTKFIERQ